MIKMYLSEQLIGECNKGLLHLPIIFLLLIRVHDYFKHGSSRRGYCIDNGIMYDTRQVVYKTSRFNSRRIEERI